MLPGRTLESNKYKKMETQFRGIFRKKMDRRRSKTTWKGPNIHWIMWLSKFYLFNVSGEIESPCQRSACITKIPNTRVLPLFKVWSGSTHTQTYRVLHACRVSHSQLCSQELGNKPVEEHCITPRYKGDRQAGRLAGRTHKTILWGYRSR